MSPPNPLTTPLVLSPVVVVKPWGGHRLHALGRHDRAAATIGESWDVADLPTGATEVPDPVSRVATGPLAGASLGELLERDPAGLLGSAAASTAGRFPLLVKVLDAAETLSIQVHPPASLAPVAHKTESWVVLDAEEGAELLLGVREGVTTDEVADALGRAELVGLLRHVPARPGDVVHLPAGTIHALGAGVLVAEVQTPSDRTHRLWDWPDQRDGGRQLHLADGLAAIRAGWEHNLHVDVAPARDGLLVSTAAYTLHRETLSPEAPVAASTTVGVARVCIVLDGGLRWVDHDGAEHERARTESVLLPAACDQPVVAGPSGATVLVATPT